MDISQAGSLQPAVECVTMENYTSNGRLSISLRRLAATLSVLLSLHGPKLVMGQPSDSASSAPRVVSTTVVYEVPDNDTETRLLGASEDGQHVAIGVLADDKVYIWNDGRKSKEYEKILYADVHPKSGSVAAFFLKKQQITVYVDGKTTTGFVDVEDSLTFSPDGTRYAFAGLRTGIFGGVEVHFILDGYSQSFSAITGSAEPPPYFSSSGRCAFSARRGDECFLVIDGKRGRTYEQTGVGPVYSEDGEHIAYAGYRNDTAYMVLDEVEYGAWTAIGHIRLSDDASRFAYTAKRNYEDFLVTNTDTLGPLETLWEPTLSSDGRHFAYVTGDVAHVRAVVDGIPGPEYHDAFPVIFSPDGRRYAYHALVIGGTGDSSKQLVVVDGSPGKSYSYIHNGTLQFSPDGFRVVYVGEIDSNRIVVVSDGVEGKEYAMAFKPIFDLSGKHLAYAAYVCKDSGTIVLDGVEGPAFTRVSQPVFSPDGEHLAYYGLRNGQWALVIDGKEFGAFGRIFPSIPRFDDSNHVAVVGEAGLARVIRLIVSAQ